MCDPKYFTCCVDRSLKFFNLFVNSIFIDFHEFIQLLGSHIQTMVLQFSVYSSIKLLKAKYLMTSSASAHSKIWLFKTKQSP